MKNIDSKKYDLNLLVVFELLMEERSVSRTAERACLNQSAMSHALARMREMLQDPVLVRGKKRDGSHGARVNPARANWQGT